MNIIYNKSEKINPFGEIFYFFPKLGSRGIRMDVKPTFGARLKRVRGDLTQEEFGKKLNVSRNSISYFEKSSRTADIVFLSSVCREYGVSADWLLGLSNNFKPENQSIGNDLGLTDGSIDFLRQLSNNESRHEYFTAINLLLSEKAAKSEMADDQLEKIELIFDTTVLELIATYLSAKIHDGVFKMVVPDGKGTVLPYANIEDMLLLQIQVALKNLRRLVVACKAKKGEATD